MLLALMISGPFSSCLSLSVLDARATHASLSCRGTPRDLRSPHAAFEQGAKRNMLEK